MMQERSGEALMCHQGFSNISWAFFMLKAFGGGSRWLMLSVNGLESLYAGAFRQFTMGRIGWSGLRTHNPQLHNRPATWKPQHEIPQAATTV